MTKHLEALLNLPELDDEGKQAVERIKDGVLEHENLTNAAYVAYKELMDFGKNTEPKFAGKIFEVASQFLGHAVNAESSKINSILQMTDLQIKKYKIDADNGIVASAENTEEVMMSRNELLENIINNDEGKET